MSINFSAKVTITQRYFTNNVLEHEFEVMETKLDLGSFRALRKMCPLNYDGGIEECGRITFDLETAHWWLDRISNDAGGLPILAAESYLDTLVKALAQCMHDPADDPDRREFIVAVEISWA